MVKIRREPEEITQLIRAKCNRSNICICLFMPVKFEQVKERRWNRYDTKIIVDAQYFFIDLT